MGDKRALDSVPVPAGADAGGLRGPHIRALIAGIAATWAMEIMRLRLGCAGHHRPRGTLLPRPPASSQCQWRNSAHSRFVYPELCPTEARVPVLTRGSLIS